MARVPGIDRVTAADIGVERTAAPQVPNLGGLDAGARAVVRVGQSIQAEGRALAVAGTVAQREDETREVQVKKTEFNREVFGLTFGDQKTGDKGFRNLRGQQAIDQSDAFRDEVEKRRSDIERDIKNEKVREGFAAASVIRRESAYVSHANYIVGERRSAEIAADQAELNMLYNEIQADPLSDFNNEREIRIIDLTLKQADRNGITDEQIRKDMVKTNLTAAYAAVIDNLLAEERVEEAQAYFQGNKAKMQQDKQSEIIADIRKVQNAKTVRLVDDVTDMVSVLDLGGNLDPTQVLAMKNRLTSTSGDRSQGLLRSLEQAEGDNKVVGSFNNLSFPQQQQRIRFLERDLAEGITTGQEARQLKKVRRVFAVSERVEAKRIKALDKRAKALGAEEEEQAEERLARLGEQVDDTTDVLDAGGNVDVAEVAELRDALSRTSNRKARSALKDLDEAIKSSDFMARFSALTQPQQEEVIREGATVLREGLITSNEVRVLNKIRRAHAFTEKEIKAGRGMKLAETNGVIQQMAPLDFTNPDSFRARKQQAAQAGDFFGVPVLPLLPEEVKELNDILVKETASPDDTARVLSAISSGLGRDTTEFLASASVDINPGMSVALLLASDQPLVAREIINGLKVLSSRPGLDLPRDAKQSAVENVLGNIFTPDTSVSLGPMVSAADALYAPQRISEGELTFDSDQYETALEKAVGGILKSGGGIFGGGQNILAPIPGMTQPQFDNALEHLTTEDLTRFSSRGKGPVFFDANAVNDIDKSELEDFQFVSSGLGRYFLRGLDGGYLVTRDGDIYEIDFRGYIESGLSNAPHPSGVSIIVPGVKE